MGVKTEADPELDEIKQDVAPEAVLDEIEATENREPGQHRGSSASPPPVSRPIATR